MSDQLALFEQPTLTVHCFWGPCTFTIQADNADRAHAQMERHYEDAHAELIARLCGLLS